MVEDVLLKIVPEALESHQDQVGRVNADGAVRRVHDDLGGGFDPAENVDLRLAVQHLLNHAGELGESNAAGNAFAAGLCLAQPQEIQRHVHRAQARGAGGDPPLHVAVELFHNGLSLAGGLYF